MHINLEDVSGDALEMLLGVAKSDISGTSYQVGKRFLDHVAKELECEIERRRRGGEPVVVHLANVPLAELGAGVQICDVVATRFAQHAERATSAEDRRTLDESKRVAVAIGMACLHVLEAQAARHAAN